VQRPRLFTVFESFGSFYCCTVTAHLTMRHISIGSTSRYTSCGATRSNRARSEKHTSLRLPPIRHRANSRVQRFSATSRDVTAARRMREEDAFASRQALGLFSSEHAGGWNTTNDWRSSRCRRGSDSHRNSGKGKL
jgi:hypothetical protein